MRHPTSLSFDNNIEFIDSNTIHFSIDSFLTHPCIKAWTYPGGEVGLKYLLPSITQNVKYFISARIRNSFDLLCLTQLAYSISNNNVIQSIFIPYLPYSRQDRTQITDDHYMMPNAGFIIPSLLKNFCGQLITFDIHSYNSDFYNISSSSQADWLKINLKPGLILFPDSGAYKRYSNLFVDAARTFSLKERDPSTGKIKLIIPNPSKLEENTKNDNILVFDDICDGGATFESLAQQIPSKFNLSLYVSHGIFSKPILNLKKYYSNIYTTNSFSLAMPEGVQVIK